MTDADQAFDRYRAAGRPEDLATVFDVCAPQLLLLANHVAGDPGVAEDLVQVTFLRAIEAVDRFEGGRPVQPWLVGILVREAKKLRRNSARVPDADRLPEPGEAPIPAEVAERKEFQDALAKALAELPQAYREVLTLRLVHGLTPTQIGHARGVSPQTIKTQIRRGTERLRQLLPPSFATALVALAGSGAALAGAREVVLQAAAAASQGIAATAAAAAAANANAAGVTAATGAASATALELVAGGAAAGVETGAAAAATAATATAATTTAAGAQAAGGGLRALAWLSGIGGAVALGVWAWDPFAADREPPRAEVREELPAPAAERPPMRAAAAAPAEAPRARPPVVDRGLVAFHGRVVSESGMGLDGVQVEVLRLHPDLLVTPAAALPNWTAEPRFVAGSDRTDDRGEFAITGVKPAGTFVVAIGVGTDRIEHHVLTRSPEPKQVVELGEMLLGRAKVSRGRIVDAQGFPVAGVTLRSAGVPWRAVASLGLAGLALAQVGSDDFVPDGGLVANWAGGRQVLTVPGWFRSLYDRLLGRSATTDDQGRFEWTASRHETLTLLASAAGFADTRISFVVRGEDHDVGQFVMQRVGSIEVLVRDWNGDPLPRAEVMLGKHRPGEPCIPIGPAGETDADGEIRVPWNEGFEVVAAVRRRPGERWHVFGPLSPKDRIGLALPRSFPVDVRVVKRSGSVRGPLDVEPVLRLLPGRFAPGLVPGVLTMHQLGCVAPLPLARRRRANAPAGAAQGAPPGIVSLDDVPAGHWILAASAPGFASTAVALDVDGVEHVTVELAPLEPTSVAVADPRFALLGDQPVYARAVEERDRVHEFPVLIGTTDEDGGLQILRSRWRRHAVGTASSEFGCCSVRAAAGVDRLAMAHLPRGVIEGRLTEHGLPALGWTVLARPVRREADGPPALWRTAVTCATDELGRFRLPPLESGTWELRGIRPVATVSHVSSLLPWMLPDAGVEPLVEVDLQPRAHERVACEVAVPSDEPEQEEEPDGPLTLHGFVRVQPRPTAGVKLGVDRGGRWQWFAVGPDGQFDTGLAVGGSVRAAVVRVAGAPPAGAPLRFLWMGHLTAARAGVALTLDLLPVTFTLSTAQRRSAAGFAVTVEGTHLQRARSRFLAVADGGGWFRLDVPKGTFALRGEHETLGWLDRKDVRIAIPISLSYRLNPLVTAAGYADAKKIGVELPFGSKVEFRRVAGGVLAVGGAGAAGGTVAAGGTAAAGGTVAVERTVALDRSARFRVAGLLPGKYRATLLPALRLRTGYVLPPEQAKIRLPQGEVEIGGGGREGIVLRKPR